MKVAILLTTFNRRQKTVDCLESLKNQVLADNVHLEVFLTDDASSDGTVDAVKSLFPSANIFYGNGFYFWAGGMRNSWKEAQAFNPDYYLLLNDDTTLFANAVFTLLQYSKIGNAAIAVGSTIDNNTGKVSYGGYRLQSKISWKPNPSVHSENDWKECDIANANIMLVPREVVNKIGILSNKYTHSLADFDYTLKAKKAGFHVLVAPGFLGTCVDDHGDNWKSKNTTLKERLSYLKSPKGLAYNEYLQFIRSHFPLSYPSAFFKLWVKTLFPFIWDSFKK